MGTSIRRRLGSSLLLLLAWTLATPAGAQHFPPDDDLRLMLRYLVEDGETPGVVLGVLDPDGSMRAVGYGSGGPGAGPVGPRSLFEIGSLTMTLTAALLADMVARGEVALDDPVAKYLPAGVRLPSLPGRETTLLGLATHRSGLPRDRLDDHVDLTVDGLYRRLADLELAPRDGYRFSNLGYGLLGHALARAAGVSYGDLLRQRVLEPLGMDATGYAPAGDAAAWMTTGHARGSAVPPTFVTEAMRGATGLRSSAEDLLRFLRANVGAPETELARAMRMTHEVHSPRGREDEDLGYGFSWRAQSIAGRPPIITHGGRAAGFVAMVDFEPAQRIGTVVLANDEAFNDRIGRRLLFFGLPASAVEARVDPALLRLYHGTYRSNVGRYRANPRQGRHFIRLEREGYLTYQAPGRVRARLYAESDSSFYLLRVPFTATFSTDGDAVRLVMRVDEREQGGSGWTAWKVGEDTPPPALVAGNVRAWQTWGPRTWALVGLLAVVVVAVIVRLLASRRTGTVRRRRTRAAWSRPGQYP